MTQYTRFIDTASRLIAKWGATGAIVPMDGSASIPVKYVVTNYSPHLVDGRLIQFLDRRVQIAAKGLSVVPDAELHRFQADDLLRIVTVKKTSPGGEDILYELQVRK